MLRTTSKHFAIAPQSKKKIGKTFNIWERTCGLLLDRRWQSFCGEWPKIPEVQGKWVVMIQGMTNFQINRKGKIFDEQTNIVKGRTHVQR